MFHVLNRHLRTKLIFLMYVVNGSCKSMGYYSLLIEKKNKVIMENQPLPQKMKYLISMWSQAERETQLPNPFLLGPRILIITFGISQQSLEYAIIHLAQTKCLWKKLQQMYFRYKLIESKLYKGKWGIRRANLIES